MCCCCRAYCADATRGRAVVDAHTAAGVRLGAAAGVVTHADGRQELHLFQTQSAAAVSSLVLANVWIPWVTGNLYLGSRRLYIGAEVHG
jgi:hypothetical protein